MSHQPCIFISHKHADQKVATTIRKFLVQSSLSAIDVFQSSDPLASGPRLGNTLSEELKQALWDSGVVLLIYTTEDQDWSYCMWECGVATKRETPQTRIIVLQCAAETPKVFKDQVHVNVREKGDVLKFVKSYLTDVDFFPGGDKALAPKLSPDGPQIKDAADELYKKLMDVIPKLEVSEWHAQPFIQLGLKAEKISKMKNNDINLEEFEKSVLVGGMDSRALQIFGAGNLNGCKSFGTLVKRLAEGKTDESRAWVKDLQKQIVRAANNEIPVPCWSQLEEADGTGRYMPVLTQVRQVPTHDVLQFDVNFVPFEEDKVLSGIRDPYIKEYQNAMKKVEEFAPSLVTYFTPIATRCFSDWSEYVRKAVSDGVEMRGPERLEITRLMVHATKKHMLVERVVGNPQEIHSRDWRSFYDKLGEDTEIDKAWMLCVEEGEIRSKASDVEAAWRFFKDRNFKTLYCSPRDVECAIGLEIGEAVQGREVIEDFGEYVKLISLPEGSYTAGTKANSLVTTFRQANIEDRRLLQSMVDCSTAMTEDWIHSLHAP